MKIDQISKKASSWKKDKLTKFNISSGELSITKNVWSSNVDWKQQKLIDLISHISGGEDWSDHVTHTKRNLKCGRSVNPIKRQSDSSIRWLGYEEISG